MAYNANNPIHRAQLLALPKWFRDFAKQVHPDWMPREVQRPLLPIRQLNSNDPRIPDELQRLKSAITEHTCWSLAFNEDGFDRLRVEYRTHALRIAARVHRGALSPFMQTAAGLGDYHD